MGRPRIHHADRSIAFIFPEIREPPPIHTARCRPSVECSLVTVTKSRRQGELTKSMVKLARSACISVRRPDWILARSKSATALLPS